MYSIQILGQDVLHSGLATHYCDSSKIPELQQTLLNMKDANDIENVLERFCPKPKSEFSLSKHLDQINKCFDAESIEEILENLKQDGSSWAKQTIRVLNQTINQRNNLFHEIIDSFRRTLKYHHQHR